MESPWVLALFGLAGLSCIAIVGIAIKEGKVPSTLIKLAVLGSAPGMRLSSQPWLVEHALLIASISAGLLAVGILLANVLSRLAPDGRKPSALPWVAVLLLIAGAWGILFTTFTGVGCQMEVQVRAEIWREREANGQVVRRHADSPCEEHVGAVYRLASSIVMIDDAFEALREYVVSPSQSASTTDSAFARLADHVDDFGRMVSLLVATFAAAFSVLLVVSTRYNVNPWAARAAWRGWLRIAMVSMAGFVFLPLCLSAIGVYLGQFWAPTYMVGAWLAGIGLGVLMTVWLLFAPAPRAQAEVTAPQS